MENNSATYLQKRPLDPILQFFCLLLILSQVGLVFYIAYAKNVDPQFGYEFGALPYIFLALFLIIFSVVFSAFCMRNREKHFFPRALLLISILFPFWSIIIPAIQPVFGPSWQERYQESPEGKKYKANLERQNAIAQVIYNEFKKPQKVIIADEEYKVLILENGYVVRLSNNPLEMGSHDQTVFIAWARENLIGKEATFSLPNYKSGMISGGVAICEDEDENIYLDTRTVREKYGIPKNKSGFCSEIPAQIIFEGESLYKKFCNKGEC